MSEREFIVTIGVSVFVLYGLGVFVVMPVIERWFERRLDRIRRQRKP